MEHFAQKLAASNGGRGGEELMASIAPVWLRH
jgi:hypothetical protein